MESENNMRKKIRELSDIDNGSIIVGGSSYASYLIMSKICSEFYKKNPNVTVTLDIGNVGSSQVLWEKIDNNEIKIINTIIKLLKNKKVTDISEMSHKEDAWKKTKRYEKIS